LQLKIKEKLDENYFAKARYNMVHNQLVPSGIIDKKIIDSFLKVCRHKFIISQWKEVAYSDSILPIFNTEIFVDDNRFIMSPLVLAKMLQFAEIKSNSVVFDFNCNTGYSSVIISNIAKKVIAVDIDKRLLKIGISQELLAQAGDVISFRLLESFKDNMEDAKFDIIIVNGIMNQIPKFFKNIIVEGGKIVLIEKYDHIAKIVKYIKHNEKLFRDELSNVDADERILVKTKL